ncbi:helix-turn-helix transcriptional regulator [Candidatus Phyllobacterium onerii]|uniref:helix-turn-helix transcriptional regulator n=1 Tax=Candidatus Phyllobacterium onerii TaxID=3020828 RepID=UPI00232FE44B|nr:hypothetical protein [Phyllobacterium sp. IY22]
MNIENTAAGSWTQSGSWFAVYSKFNSVEREWYNQTDFAKLLGISVMTIWRFEHGYTTKTGKSISRVEGFPKSVNLGGRRLWRKTDIDLFMAGLASQ